MKVKDNEIAPLIRAYILLNQINSGKKINRAFLELKNMCNCYGEEFYKNINLISFNQIDFKKMENSSKKPENEAQNITENESSFFVLNLIEFLENENFVKIFGNLLMDAKNEYSLTEVMNGLKQEININIEQELKIILGFIESKVEKYINEENMLFLEKCKIIHEQKIFCQIKDKKIIEHIINILFNILKIKNRQESQEKQENENKNEIENEKEDIIEQNIKKYIQSFSYYNEQLKASTSTSAPTSSNFSINKEKEKDNKSLNDNNNKKKKNKMEKNDNDDEYIDNKIEIERLIYDLGPFILKKNINFSNIPYIDMNLDENRLSQFIIFIINNQEIVYNKGFIYLNKILLESMKTNNINITDETSISLNDKISWDLNVIFKLFGNSLDNIDKKELLNFLEKNPFFIIDTKKKFDFMSEIFLKLNIFGEENINSKKNNSNSNYSNYNFLFFENFVFKKWKNIQLQIKLFELIINNKEISENSIFSLNNYQGQKIKKDIELKAYTSSKNQYLIENWRTVKLIETLLLLSEDEKYYNQLKKIFDWATKNIPEIIIMALLIIKIDYNENNLMKELILEILPPILNDKNPRTKLVDEIWQKNKDIVIFTLYNSWKNLPDLMNLSLIFDLSISLLKDSILPLVNSKYHNFSVHLGLLASKRDYLHIEKWLKKNIENYGDDFIHSLLDYLRINIIQPCQSHKDGIYVNENNKANILEKAQLSLESLSIILNTLTSYSNDNNSNNNDIKINNSNINKDNNNDNNATENKKLISQKTKNEIAEINKIIFDIYDEIQDQQINSTEIENEVSELLRSMFAEKISVDKIITLLINYKSSSDKKQNEIYSCLIHGLLVEFHNYSQYPKNDLKLISELFGKIINNKLLKGIIENLALAYILEGIKSKEDILYFFGINALTQFIGKISHWPEYVKKLLNTEQLKQKNNNIYLMILQEKEKMQKKSNSSEPSVDVVNNVLSDKFSIEENNNTNTNTSINNENINKDKEKDQEKEKESVHLLKNKLSGITKSYIVDEEYHVINNERNNFENIELPKEEIINKIKNIFNSLNKTNTHEKSLEISKLLGNDEKTIRWFSYYFITTKINHWKNISLKLYNELFNQINNPLLSKYNLKDTIKYIQELLSLDYLYIDEQCKNLLKNLGTWLGFNTLSKNRPIFIKDMDFRELIINSYKIGQLNTIIPFVCKVFGFISKTKIFNSNNPWINSILSLLKEIHQKSLLNLSLKKEIESFFEGVKIEMSSITNSTKYLNNIPRLDSKNHDFPDSQRYEIFIDLRELTKKISSLNDYINNLLNILNNDKNNISGFYYNNKKYNNNENNIGDLDISANNSSNSHNNISTHKNIEKQKEIISMLRNVMYLSILDVIPELISMYVEKPIISAITIVNKDFMFERDVNKYKTALSNTLQFILKSFSIMCAHELLKKNIESNFDKYYKVKKFKKDTINKIKQLPSSEYINIGLEYIKLFIMKEANNTLNLNKKVLDEIDKRTQGNLNLSKNDFYKEYSTKIRHKMPLILKPDEEHIKDKEYKIYQNLKTNGFKLFVEDSSKSTFLNIVYRILKEVMDKAPEDNSPNKINTYKNYDLCMKNIQNISKNNTFYNFDEDQQLSCLKTIIYESKIEQKEVINQLALYTFKYIIESVITNNYLLLNVYIFILRGWIKLNNDLMHKITSCLFEYDIDIEIKFKYKLHFYLLKQKVLDNDLYKSYLIKLLCTSSVQNIVIQNLVKLLVKDNNNISSSLKSFLDKNKIYYEEDNNNNKSKNNFYLLFNKNSNILKDLANNYIRYNSEKKKNLCVPKNNKNSELFELKNNYIIYFVSLIHHFNSNYYGCSSNENNEIEKPKNPILSNDIPKFMKEICQLCMNESYDEKFITYINYFYPENLSIFIYSITFLDNEINKNNNEEKIRLFNDLLDIIVDNLHKNYLVNQVNFNQKKYYRFFINLIYLIAKKDSNNNNDYLALRCMLLICDKLKILSPMNYPGFAIAWIDLISYNYFVQNFLDSNLIKENSYKYEEYLLLLTELLSFLSSFKNKSISNYYYKIFLDKVFIFFYIFANSYSSFIISYCYILIPYISLSSGPKDEDNNSFLQLKNIILSASPLHLLSNKKINKEINKNFYKENFLSSKVLKDNFISNKIINLLLDNENKTKISKKESDMELYLLLEKFICDEKSDEKVLESLLDCFEKIKDEKELIGTYNGIVVYWCQKKQKYITENKIKSKKAFYNFYFFLLCNLDEINKKFLIDSILNALRFPCSQAISYSLLFQELFVNIENEDIEKQLLENILERMLYHPIPWGIKYTFSSLLANEKYQKFEKKYINNTEVREFINKINNDLKENANTNGLNEFKNNI